MSGLQTGQVSVGTTATLVCTVGAVPDSDGVLINSSAAAFVGGAGVTASTGFPVPANTPTLFPTTGAEPVEVYGVVSSSTATIGFAYPG